MRYLDLLAATSRRISGFVGNSRRSELFSLCKRRVIVAIRAIRSGSCSSAELTLHLIDVAVEGSFAPDSRTKFGAMAPVRVTENEFVRRRQ